MQGNVRDFSLAEVLQFISLGRRNGQLSIQSGPERYCLTFGNGVIVASDGATTTILKVLSASGLVSSRGLDTALAECQREGRDLGIVLIQQGQLSATDWDRFMARELERVIYSLFILNDAPFAFQALANLPPAIVQLNLPVDRVVLHGTGWAEQWKSIRPSIPSVQSVYAPTIPHRLLVEEARDERERRVAQAFQRQADIHSLAVLTNLTLIETAKIVAALARAQRVRLVSAN